jgi:protease-4
MDKVGIYPQVFKSGRFKDMLSGSKKPEEIDPQEKEMIQNMINETYGKFKKVVADGRKHAAEKNHGAGRSLSPSRAELADGRVLTGSQAYANGFVDELGNFETAVARAEKIAGISSANLIRYQEPFNLSHLFGLFGKSDSKGVKIDMGIDFPRLQAGHLYFLSSTVVN